MRDYSDVNCGTDYFMHIFLNNLFILEIPISEKCTVNKYTFLQKIYQNLPFTSYWTRNRSLTFKSMESISSFIEPLSSDMDNDIRRLYASTKNEISNEFNTFIKDSTVNFTTITNILFKLSILLQNIYIYKRDKCNIITYKTSSFKIETILWTIENLSGKQLIYSCRFDSKSMNAITQKLKADNYAKKNTDDYFFTLYLEFLLLTFNAYNNEIKDYGKYEW